MLATPVCRPLLSGSRRGRDLHGNSRVLCIQPELAQEGRDGLWAGMFPQLHRLLLQEGHILKWAKIGLLTLPHGYEGCSGWWCPILEFVVSWLLEALWFLLVF